MNLEEYRIENYSADHKLRDGGSVHIRPIRPEDKKLLQEGFRRLSQESIYSRFLGFKKELTRDDLAYFTEIDHDLHVALAATAANNDAEEIVGVGRYIEIDKRGPGRAEVALAVVDEHQNRGIGSLLFEGLIQIARSKGISRFEAYASAGSKMMIDIFKRYGSDVQISMDSGILHLSCSVSGSGCP